MVQVLNAPCQEDQERRERAENADELLRAYLEEGQTYLKKAQPLLDVLESEGVDVSDARQKLVDGINGFELTRNEFWNQNTTGDGGGNKEPNKTQNGTARTVVKAVTVGGLAVAGGAGGMAIGAQIGGAVGGPVGLVVGGLTGLVIGLITDHLIGDRLTVLFTGLIKSVSDFFTSLRRCQKAKEN